MIAVHETANKIPLLITSYSEALNDITSSKIAPSVALLSVFDENWKNRYGSFIKALITKKCKFFVCFGTYSDKLEEFIDDLSCSRYDELSQVLITTQHKDDAIEEIIYFFVNVATVTDGCQDGLVAILENDSNKSLDVVGLLLKA
jgi:hypothetical protein